MEPDSERRISLEDVVDNFEYIVESVDWSAVWDEAPDDEELLAWPLLPKGRQVALYGEAKSGKSLLALELVGCLVTGRPFLGQPTVKSRVLYVDFENSLRRDVIPRLKALGFDPYDFTDLAYLSLPPLPRFDSEEGGKAIIANLGYNHCDVLVIDTVSMAIAGEENSNDTWLRFQQHTGLALKRDDITVLRIDHAGKGSATGPRGGSAKGGSVDAEWRVKRYSDGTLTLKCETHRMPIQDQELTIETVEDPCLSHQVVGLGRKPSRGLSTVEIADALDEEGYPQDITDQESRTALKDLGLKAGSAKRAQAIKIRKERHRLASLAPVGNPKGDHLSDDDEYLADWYDESEDVEDSEDHYRDNRFELVSLDSFRDGRG